MKTARSLLVSVLLVCLLSSGPAGAAAKRWKMAARLWRSVKSTMGSGHWRQAEGLLQEFISKFGSHENVPAAYLYLAKAKRTLNDPNGEAETLDATIRRFGGSPVWYAAYARLLERRRLKNDRDGFLDTFEKMLSRLKFMPLDFSLRAKAGENATWFTGPGGVGWRAPEFSWVRGVGASIGIQRDLLWVADTPERMERVFKLIGPSIARYPPDQLPIGWQFGYVLLLEKAGKGEQAEKLFQTYAKAWGDDPRGMVLWALRARHLQAAKDYKGAEAIFQHLVKNYMGYTSLSAMLRPWFAYLYQQQRYHDFVPLAKKYLEVYPWGRDRKTVLQYWLSMLRTPAVKGDLEALADTHSVLDKYYGPKSLFKRTWLIDLNIAMNNPAQAVELARPYLNDDEWSRQTYALLKAYAARCKPFQALVDEADKKYRIFAPDPDPNSEPVKLLAELKDRIKDNQVRHMEEIGERIFSKHRDTHEAVEALKLLADYYFKKVIAKPRDAWTRRMIQAYPRHPDTQKVLATHVQSMRASRLYHQMGDALDLFKRRFPTARPPFSWYGYRMEAYSAIKNVRGPAALVLKARKALAARAHTGNFAAIQALARFEIPKLAAEEGMDPNSAQIGGYWMKLAKKHQGTRTELHCLWAAYNAYFTYPWAHRSRGKVVLEDEALDALARLQTQTMDPEVRWNLRFADVGVFLAQWKVEEALRRLKRKFKNGEKVRDVRLRFNFAHMGQAIARDKKVLADGLEYAGELRKICFTQADQNAIAVMEAEAWYYAGAKAKTMKFYLDRALKDPWPIHGYSSFQRAYSCAVQISPAAAKRVTDRYLNRISRCQATVPRMGNRYPSSASRGRLEAAYDAFKARLKK